MRTIDESIRYSYRYRVEYWSTYDKLRAEADRVLADPTTSESVRAYLTKWCATELNRILQWGRGVKLPLNFRGTHWLGRGHVTTHSKMYVKNFEKDSFIPIEYYTVTSPYSQRIQHILARALEFPVEEVIKFRGKFGTTFAELGVPRGPDGAPEFWVVSGLDGTMTKYKPAAA